MFVLGGHPKLCDTGSRQLNMLNISDEILDRSSPVSPSSLDHAYRVRYRAGISPDHFEQLKLIE